MRISIRKILVCFLALFSVGAVASASASAEICHSPDGDQAERTVCLKNKEGVKKELEAPNKLEGTSATSVLTATVLGAKVKITCTSDKFVDEPGSFDRESKGTVTFKECAVTEPEKNCKLPAVEKEKIVAPFTNLLELASGSATKVIFTGAGEKELFAEITLENNGTENCAIKGTYKITGNTGSGCTFDSTIETFKLEHELTCVATGEALKLGGNTATFTTTAKIKSSTGEEFDISTS